ncbi:MAG TPA: hypothetical protein VFE42_21515 [Chloroflexota bacterium]|jgi:hypothetical protein|nr:hypothetical protein [Chloroflexota bacterium]
MADQSRLQNMWDHLHGHGHDAQPASVPLGSPMRPGPRVLASDGAVLGTVVRVWSGGERRTEGATDDEDYVQVQHEDEALFIPGHAVSQVSDQAVHVNATAEQARTGPWRYRPAGVPPLRGRPGILGEDLPAALDPPHHMGANW